MAAKGEGGTQKLCQPGCDGLHVLGDRLRQSLELLAPNAQGDRRVVAQVLPPGGMGAEPVSRLTIGGTVGHGNRISRSPANC